MMQKPGQKPKVVYGNKDGFEVGAVSQQRGMVRFALSKNQRRGVIMGIGRGGKPFPVANLGVYEKKTNADHRNTYGFRNLDGACAAAAAAGLRTGDVQGDRRDAPVRHGDGRPDDVRRRRGRERDLRHPAARQGDHCGRAAAREGQDHGCRRGGDRHARVCGREDLRVRAGADRHRAGPRRDALRHLAAGRSRGRQPGCQRLGFRVNPRTGKVTTVVSGPVSPTGLAVAGNGDIFVAELFRGRISRTKAGQSKPHGFLNAPLPAEVELTEERHVRHDQRPAR